MCVYSQKEGICRLKTLFPHTWSKCHLNPLKLTLQSKPIATKLIKNGCFEHLGVNFDKGKSIFSKLAKLKEWVPNEQFRIPILCRSSETFMKCWAYNQTGSHVWGTTPVIVFLILRHLWYLVLRALFAKGLKHMLGGMKVSYPLIATMILFVNIRNFSSGNLSTLWHLV